MNTTETQKPKQAVTTRPAQQVDVGFMALLQQHRGGDALSDLSAALKAVTEAVFLQGKPGSITLKLKLSPATRTAGAMIVQDEITSKPPMPEPEGSIFFADQHNWQLMRDNPNQLALSLKTVDGMASHGETLRDTDENPESERE